MTKNASKFLVPHNLNEMARSGGDYNDDENRGDSSGWGQLV